MIDNKTVLKSLIWNEYHIDSCFNKIDYKRYNDVLSQVLMDMYKDFFVGKYFRSYGELTIYQITGMVKRSMGLRFVLDNPQVPAGESEKYFFSSDYIFDDEY